MARTVALQTGKQIEREHGRSRVVPMARTRIRRKPCYNDVRAEFRSQGNEFTQELFAIPNLKRFFWIFTESKVRRRSKKLLGAVDFSGFAQLRFADCAQGGAQLGTDQVLSALAPGKADVGDFAALRARPMRNQARVLVVGVGRHVKDSLHRLRGE